MESSDQYQLLAKLVSFEQLGELKASLNRIKSEGIEAFTFQKLGLPDSIWSEEDSRAVLDLCSSDSQEKASEEGEEPEKTGSTDKLEELCRLLETHLIVEVTQPQSEDPFDQPAANTEVKLL